MAGITTTSLSLAVWSISPRNRFFVSFYEEDTLHFLPYALLDVLVHALSERSPARNDSIICIVHTRRNCWNTTRPAGPLTWRHRPGLYCMPSCIIQYIYLRRRMKGNRAYAWHHIPHRPYAAINLNILSKANIYLRSTNEQSLCRPSMVNIAEAYQGKYLCKA